MVSRRTVHPSSVQKMMISRCPNSVIVTCARTDTNWRDSSVQIERPNGRSRMKKLYAAAAMLLMSSTTAYAAAPSAAAEVLAACCSAVAACCEALMSCCG